MSPRKAIPLSYFRNKKQRENRDYRPKEEKNHMIISTDPEKKFEKFNTYS